MTNLVDPDQTAPEKDSEDADQTGPKNDNIKLQWWMGVTEWSYFDYFVIQS